VVGSGRRCLAVDSGAGLSLDARHAGAVVAEEAMGAEGSARCGKQNLGLGREEREEGQREMTVKMGRRRENEIKQ
jgi:hypothetical protein